MKPYGKAHTSDEDGGATERRRHLLAGGWYRSRQGEAEADADDAGVRRPSRVGGASGGRKANPAGRR